MQGRVVGINSAGSDAAENIGFAIAIDAAVDTIQAAIRDPLGAQAYLGVTSQDVTPEAAYQLGLSVDAGAYVVATTSDGPAAAAGVQEGDVIVAIADQPVTSAEDVGITLERLDAGQEVTIEVVRPNGSAEVFNVILGTRPLPTVLP
jgi:S1-C subfamily serine protease